MASSTDTFIQHPLHIDPASKAISAPSSASPALIAELEALNLLHRSLLNLDSPNTPPPPRPVHPKRSAQIGKLRDSANAAFRKGSYDEAVRLYSYAIEMALGRPHWEAAGLVREELAPLYANRSQAHMSQQHWAEGWVDAQTSVECGEGPGNMKARWRGGKCLVEMGRLEEAREWLGQGLEIEGRNSDGTKEMRTLLGEVESALAAAGKRV
jgi:translocation protein SEC72